MERCSRVARWYIFKPKNPNLGKFLEGLGMEKVGTYIKWPIGI
jgi:hypothetical protein